MRLARLIAFACMFDGKFAEASSWLQRALEFSQTRGMPPDLPRVFYVLLGLAALRQGEIENCLECMGPSSCIFPLEPGAVHRQQAGSREAVKQFTAYLEDAPDDLRARWLLNIAYMTLGEYPQRFGVPSEQWIKEVGDGLRRRTLA
jgi:tetratricopeptide (TPR) repeat protein